MERHKIIAFLCTILLCMTSFVLPAKAQDVIRVGYFAFEGYHNMAEDGTRSGYGYEYLQQMARYTGWTYDYVGYDKSWGEAQEMLQNGQIDILTSAQKTEEREKIFDFSQEPIGYSSTIFTIKAGNDKYTIDNFASFNGIRVGMIEGNSRNAEFDSFAKEKGFSYDAVMFDDMDALVQSLQDEKIDAIVTSSLRVTKNEWVVSEFGFSPYYVCVKKGNQELLDQVNAAIGQINQNVPGLQNQLEDKYYSTDSSDEVAFTEVERQYISKFQESGQKLKVMINPDRSPLSYYNQNGEMAGIYGEVAKQILEKTGLPYETVIVKDREEYNEYKEAHKVDLCMDMRQDYSLSESLGYRVTDSYNSSMISKVSLDGNEKVDTIAAVKGSDIAANLQKNIYGEGEIVYYETGKECVNAVKTGQQDAAFLYTYVAEEALKSDIRHQLSATLVPDFKTDFCVGIGKTEDTTLFSIINKSVNSINELWIDEVTENNIDDGNVGFSFMEFVYTHPFAMIIVAVILLLMIATMVLLLYRQSVQKKDEERAREIARLFNYVCKANESVMEVNLQAMTAREYYLENGILRQEVHQYETKENFNNFMIQEDYDSVEKILTPEKMHELIAGGEEYVFEARARAKDGSYQWYIFTLYGLVPDEKRPANFMLFKRNINTLKEREEKNRKALMDALQVAKEASEAKGTFMSRMSHEIRTPLNAVIGYMTLADDVLNEPEKVGDYIKKSQTAARHLLNIINDVLDISAIESGKIKIASEEFDLKELLSSISLMFYSQAKEKNVEFNVKIDDMTEEVVVGDQLRLNQILMNLLSNAMKFTPEHGTIDLSVTQLQVEDDNVRFRFVVADTGIGMSQEFKDRIFSPFEQETAGTARKFGGSGLGLSITKNLITMMHGSIQVESVEGEGSTFTVHLVFQKSEHGSNKKMGDFTKLRALIVDDEKRSCEYMQKLLDRCKVMSDVVYSGEAAVRQIMRREGTDYGYDLCLIDWNLTGIDGVETARRIREDCKKDMPIIIASAYDTNEIRDAALKAGVNKLISKPLFQSTMFNLLVDTYGKYEPEGMKEDAQQADFTGVKVLLAEDNEMNREIAVDILKKRGLIIDTAVDGKDAVEKFTQAPKGTYQVILMDVQMPIMDGYEATKAIRNSGHEQAKDIPILAMTANAFTEDVTAALAAGMNDHIAKPINYEKLYQALQKYLNRGDGSVG